MKFGKEFTSQMVQEWQGAYMDYNYLKKLLKNCTRLRQQNAASNTGPQARKGFLTRKPTMYRAFSGLMGRNNSTLHSPKKKDEDVILVSPVQHEGSENYYQTKFLRMSEEGSEYEAEFFKKLDDELNKVVRFYEAKVQEVKEEAEELSKQMDALIALRIKVDKPAYVEQTSVEEVKALNQLVEKTKGLHMNAIQEIETTEGASEDEQKKYKKDKIDLKGFRPAPVEVLNHVKIKVDPDTPISTLRNVIMHSKSDPSLTRDELSKAEGKLRKAFFEFYQQLQLLKNYSLMNMLAFSKIMKKYDKITSRNASKTYLDIVEKSYLGSCNEVLYRKNIQFCIIDAIHYQFSLTFCQNITSTVKSLCAEMNSKITIHHAVFHL